MLFIDLQFLKKPMYVNVFFRIWFVYTYINRNICICVVVYIHTNIVFVTISISIALFVVVSKQHVCITKQTIKFTHWIQHVHHAHDDDDVAGDDGNTHFLLPNIRQDISFLNTDTRVKHYICMWLCTLYMTLKNRLALDGCCTGKRLKVVKLGKYGTILTS